MDLIIRNGTIVTASGSFDADIAVENGKIVDIGRELEMHADKEVDASGLLVLPGALDAHTHMQMPFGGTTSADSYLSGTRAAVCGGVTSIFDYPVQHEGGTIMDLVVEPLTLAAVIGAVGTFLTAVLTRANWSGNTKRWVAIGVVVILTVVALLVYQFPDQWQVVAGALAIAVGASQFVYTLLKPTGILDFIQETTTPTGTRSDVLR